MTSGFVVDRQYANLKTLYNRHRRWSAEGTWAGIHKELRCGCDQTPKGSGFAQGMRVDSTVVRVHQRAASASYSPRRIWPSSPP
jgi:transposase